MKVLIASDAHVPDREREIPREIVEFLQSQAPFDLVLYAGDFTGEETYRFFESLGEEFRAVRGNMDYLPLKEIDVVELGSLKAVLLHGHQVRPRGNLDALNKIAERFGASVAIHGHLHYPLVKVHKGVLHLNPGSITGTWGGATLGEDPSFMILSLPEWRLDLYRLKGGRLVRETFELAKA